MLFTYGALYGAAVGGALPRIWNEAGSDDHANDVGAGVLAGLGTGATAAAVWSQFNDYARADVGEIIFGSTITTSIGVGLGLVLSEDDGLAVPGCVIPEACEWGLTIGLGHAARLGAGRLQPYGAVPNRTMISCPTPIGVPGPGDVETTTPF